MGMSLSKLGIGDGEGGLVCCDSRGHKELGATELNWIEGDISLQFWFAFL